LKETTSSPTHSLKGFLPVTPEGVTPRSVNQVKAEVEAKVKVEVKVEVEIEIEIEIEKKWRIRVLQKCRFGRKLII